MLREKTIKNHSDIQKKLYVYIPMIIDLHENIVLSYKEIQKELLNNFMILKSSCLIPARKEHNYNVVPAFNCFR